jgi:hypothetical protein
MSMRIALPADHGYDMKVQLIARLRDAGHEVTDYGAATLDPDDDYSDFVVPSPAPFRRLESMSCQSGPTRAVENLV